MAGAARLKQDERVAYYWDPDLRLGSAFQHYIANLGAPARDVWMLFLPGVLWDGDTPPAPTWWEHQLGVLTEDYGDLRLDPDRFAQKAVELNSVGD